MINVDKLPAISNLNDTRNLLILISTLESAFQTPAGMPSNAELLQILSWYSLQGNIILPYNQYFYDTVMG